MDLGFSLTWPVQGSAAGQGMVLTSLYYLFAVIWPFLQAELPIF